MDEPAIDECFRLLKVRRGADFSAVKKAYRRNLYKCHPDRFQGKADLLPVAERKTKRLVQVYGVLEKWYEDNGGFDMAGSRGDAGPRPGRAGAREEPPEGKEAPRPRSRGFGIGIAAATVAVVLAGLFLWLNSEPPARVARAPGAGAPPPAPAPEPAASAPLAPAPAAQEGASAELAAMLAGRERAGSLWTAAYLRDREAEKRADARERADAQVQYDHDVRDSAPQVRDALVETARQVEKAKADSALAREDFARRLQATLAALKLDYDAWLLARGEVAVSVVKKLRQRENSEVGVFSDTEDPRRILEFWTPGEAGAPEINIAAKTGVAVQEPDGRFFPHFRSNIFLYDPEGQVLKRMMESIVERHAALVADIGAKTLEGESELAEWDTRHPPGAIHLGPAQQSAIDARDRAVARLAKATTRLEAATQAATPAQANAAFERSPAGRTWAERIAALRKGPAPAKVAH